MSEPNKPKYGDFAALKRCSAEAVKAEMPRGARLETGESYDRIWDSHSGDVEGYTQTIVNPDRSVLDQAVGTNKPAKTLDEAIRLGRLKVDGVQVNVDQDSPNATPMGIDQRRGVTRVIVSDYQDHVGPGHKVYPGEFESDLDMLRDKNGLHLEESSNEARMQSHRSEAVRARIVQCVRAPTLKPK